MSDNCRLVDCKASDKEIKRKQIFLHNDAPFMDPRLTRKLSYTETHNQRQSEKGTLMSFGLTAVDAALFINYSYSQIGSIYSILKI